MVWKNQSPYDPVDHRERSHREVLKQVGVKTWAKIQIDQPQLYESLYPANFFNSLQSPHLVVAGQASLKMGATSNWKVS
jgi:hypothetical protein